MYFVSRKYVAAVEPIHDSELLKNKQDDPTFQQVVPSPSQILQNPDDNDVRMFNPDDNYSISIRRSSIRPSRHSQIEQQYVCAYTPPTTSASNAIVPTITYSDINPTPEKHDMAYSPQSIHTLPITRQPSPSSPSSPSSHTVHSSTSGLGISIPSEKQRSHLQTNNLLVPPANTNKNTLSVSPNMSPSGRLKAPSDNRSLDITLAPPGSPSKLIHSHRSSILSSALSFRSSSMVVPEDPDEKISQEILPPLIPETQIHQHTRFVAFHPKPWLNPFYLAIMSCSILTISILFMIVFDLTMLGLGTDVFG